MTDEYSEHIDVTWTEGMPDWPPAVAPTVTLILDGMRTSIQATIDGINDDGYVHYIAEFPITVEELRRVQWHIDFMPARTTIDIIPKEKS